MQNKTCQKQNNTYRYNRYLKTGLTIGLLLMPVAAFAQQSPTTTALPAPLTLQAAVAAALKLQPDLTAATANKDASAQRLKQTQANYYPTVRPTFTYSNQYNYGTVNRFITSDGGGGTVVPVSQGSSSETRQGEIALSYRVLDSGTRELNNRQARQNLSAQEYSAANTRQSVITTVAENYFSALRTAALVKVSEAQVARAQNTLEVVRAQVDSKVAARKDTYQAEADLLNAQVALQQARNNAALAQANLKNAIGVVGGETLTLADVTAPTEATPTTATLENGTSLPAVSTDDAASINQLAELAYHARPDIAQSQKSVEASHTSIRLAQVNAGISAALDVSAGYQYEPSGGSNRQVNLSLSYPLFDGGLVRSQVRETQAQKRAVDAQLTGLKQQVAVEVEQAYRTLAQSRVSLPAARSAQEAAEINYQAALESRREGVGSIVEVITAQTSLVQAQQNYVQAVYDFYTADAQLARAVGQADRIAQGTQGTATTTTPGGTMP
jgi:outer membrane protein